MVKTKSTIPLIVFLMLFSRFASGEDISFRASVDRKSVSRSGRILYTLTVEGVQNASPQPPDLKDFQVLGSSVSTQFSLVNNRTRVSKNITYTLQPTRTGDLTIPPAVLNHAGKTYRTDSVGIAVSDTASASSQSPAQSARQSQQPAAAAAEENSPLFIRTEVDRKEAYANQQITLDFKLYSRGVRIGDLEYTPPPTVGFLEERLGDSQKYRRVIEGREYEVVKLSSAIFPVSSGELTIGPAELNGNIVIPSRRRGFFDGFFGDPFGERRPFSLASRPITVNVKPLPEAGQPADFSDAVGDFKFRASAAPLSVKVGEPITVTMKITGTGNINSLSPPKLDGLEGFKTYPPEVETKRGVAAGQIYGEKTYKQVVVPLEPDRDKIPPISFSFFDPARQKYITVKEKAIPVTVAPAAEKDSTSLIEMTRPGAGKEKITLLGKDILYIKDSPGNLRPPGPPFYRRLLFWLYSPGFLAVVAAVLILAGRNEKLRTDTVFARRSGASGACRRRLKEAGRLLRNGDSSAFYSEASRALSRYLGDKLNLPPGAVTIDNLEEKLSASAEPGIVDEIRARFSDLDRARFAPGSAGKKEMNDCLAGLEDLFCRLEKMKIK